MTRVSRHDVLDGGVLNRADGDACPGRDRYHLRSSVVLEILTLNRLQCPGERCLVGSRPQRALARIRMRAKNHPRNVGNPVGKRDRHWASPITQATLDCDIPDLLCRGLRYFL